MGLSVRRRFVEEHDPFLVIALKTLVTLPLSQREIAKRLGVSQFTLRSMLARNQIAREPLGVRVIRSRMAQ